ncbi:MAG: (2Fe-2S) ferredoxin domain-containing protein [Defluviitaleaceae bacterium]|nr:(2Fe-2S) ferredoxin domain-containing protein [Defluviitaleaceae bacterium]
MIKSREDLMNLRNKYRDDVIMRLISYDSSNRTEVMVGMADCGIAAGARDTLKVLFDEVNNARLEDVSVIAVDCMGNCDNEPIVQISTPGKPVIRYKKVDTALAKEIVAKHLVGGSILDHARMEV